MNVVYLYHNHFKGVPTTSISYNITLHPFRWSESRTMIQKSF